MKLIIGLGNPGKEYEKTNHNVGFRVIDEVVKNLDLCYEKKMICESEVAVYGIGENRIIFAKPMTYMNNSGLAVVKLVKKYNINPSTDLVIVADDFDTKEGTIRIREKSGNTTHNGIRSIKNELKTNEFIRFKVSIAPKPEYMSVVDYVLARSTNPSIRASEKLAVDALMDFVGGTELGIVMGKFSK